LKKTKILFFLILLCACAVPASAQKTVDIFGYYSIVQPTKAFADISELHLGGNYGEIQTPKFYGFIRMKNKRALDYKLLKPALSDKNLTFATKAVGNVSYKFVGTFTKLGDFPELQPNGEILLTGKLSKYRGKKRIASANVKLSYFAGD
jgi:hypothetical protein